MRLVGVNAIEMKCSRGYQYQYCAHRTRPTAWGKKYRSASLCRKTTGMKSCCKLCGHSCKFPRVKYFQGITSTNQLFWCQIFETKHFLAVTPCRHFQTQGPHPSATLTTFQTNHLISACQSHHPQFSGQRHFLFGQRHHQQNAATAAL